MARQAQHVDITPISLSDAEVADLVAFMHALTGTASVETPPFGVPASASPHGNAAQTQLAKTSP